MSRRALFILVSLFLISRAGLAWLADNPHIYRSGIYDATGDAVFYEEWARQVVDDAKFPYSEVRIEYPPGALPFILAPRIALSEDLYRKGLGALFVAADAAGLAGLVALARRRGSLLGAWLWVALVPLLGPIAYGRLDIVPAAATVLMLERAAAEQWFGVGGWLAYGALAKVYPLVLVPSIFAVASRRRSLIAGFAVVTVAALLPFVGLLPNLWDSVVGYHAERGIQVESLWGMTLLVASKFGYSISVVHEFGAEHVRSSLSPTLKVVGLAASLTVLGAATVVAARRPRRGDTARLASLLFATLTLLVAVGTVFSPQYVLWLIALGTGAACWTNSPTRPFVFALVPIALLTQLLFPFLYARVLAGDAVAVAVLALRNLLVLATGAAALAAVARGHTSTEIPSRQRNNGR
jgi:hypothetical protein